MLLHAGISLIENNLVNFQYVIFLFNKTTICFINIPIELTRLFPIKSNGINIFFSCIKSRSDTERD